MGISFFINAYCVSSIMNYYFWNQRKFLTPKNSNFYNSKSSKFFRFFYSILKPIFRKKWRRLNRAAHFVRKIWSLVKISTSKRGPERLEIRFSDKKFRQCHRPPILYIRRKLSKKFKRLFFGKNEDAKLLKINAL